MKKSFLLALILVLATLACTNFDSILGGNSGNVFPSQSAGLFTLAPTLPVEVLEATATSAPEETQGDSTPTTDNTPENAAPTVGDDPKAWDFFTCTTPCIYNGSNDQSVFAEKTKIIHFSFEFENFPQGASYTRVWTKDGVEWARYQCSWFGAASGIDQITLTEPAGLASGIWEVKITLDGEIVLQESLEIEGSWAFWDPAGYFGSCYGKR